MLAVSGIAKRFGATVALDRVDFAVRAGEVHALIGENGAGKSTLMSVIAGTMRPDAGHLQLGGRPYAPTSAQDARTRGVALMHQDLSLCPHLTVEDNILLGAERARWGWIDAGVTRARALGVLEQFSHPSLRPDARVADLPVAAQQIVEICRALAANARVVLMDEPTSRLQRGDVERLFAIVRRLRDDGIAVVYISHFLEEVREIADAYTVLRDGRSVDTGALADVADQRLISRMVGRDMSEIFPARRRHVDGEPVLEVRDVSAPPALVRASFAVRRGEVFGIAGLMGSGRTELLRALYGLADVSGGSISVGGRRLSLARATSARRLRDGLGYLSEDRKGEGLLLPLSLADNFTASRLDAFVRGGGWLDRAAQRARSERLVEELRVRARSVLQPVRELSGGNQQKVAMGRLLHQDADVFLLDEPTRGVDIGSRENVYAAIARAADEAKGIVLVSSYLPELFGMADRIAVMRRGVLTPARPVGEWTPETLLAAAIGGAPEGDAA